MFFFQVGNLGWVGFLGADVLIFFRLVGDFFVFFWFCCVFCFGWFVGCFFVALLFL